MFLPLLAVLAALLPRAARAEEEVRIAIVAGKAKVRVAATKLAVYDGDSGDRVYWSDYSRAASAAAWGWRSGSPSR